MKPPPSTGVSYPLGAIPCDGGVNFCVFTKHATLVELLLFDAADDEKPSHVLPFDPEINRTYYYWHQFVPGIKAGQRYGYRVCGPYQPDQGFRFDGNKLLVDPYARCVETNENYSRGAAATPGDNLARSMKSIVVDPTDFDWEGDKPLSRPYAHTVIYELHVGGLTRHRSSGVVSKKRGTYAGLIEKIPYLVNLGITAVELMPVQQFDDQDVPGAEKNYWGYSPVAFFAPHAAYSSDRTALGPVNEFREMVKALHRAGIEVILDVVFNHTAEGDANGPTLSLRGFENLAYYMLDRDTAAYVDYSGTGNTLNANHSIVRRMISDCLRYWVSEMHVDGFRFDLASVLARDEAGIPLTNPPILWSIESDPVLAGTKIIAEAWDAAGLYQVGSFVGHRWAEWNGPFRDAVRRFMKGDRGMIRELSARITGSPDIYTDEGRDPNRSINFVTSHDGFTMNDLVSYSQKHNEANGEGNRDGTENNYSWNWGVEGPTKDTEINALRLKQIKNFFTLLLFSQGTPMFVMGDEICRTQRGNNNSYCQDNELNWFDWRDLDNNHGLLRFVRGLIYINLSHEAFQQKEFWTHNRPGKAVGLSWHGVHLGQPDWSDDSHSLAFTLHNGEELHFMLNAYWGPLDFELPRIEESKRWRRIIDTHLESPDDFCEATRAPIVKVSHYTVESRSTVVLIAN